ncbi:hypothetical protein Vadar_030697 [Vaccinium darrowii]|uniref:Uncharacterized protein n=1 Tax=Vaccinium darrowii TaxID=229202 RepID=A0ACB7YHE3_9ERIC|nr:hypothetical protein Vadar_030697 [Vaccinium darrowii]
MKSISRCLGLGLTNGSRRNNTRRDGGEEKSMYINQKIENQEREKRSQILCLPRDIIFHIFFLLPFKFVLRLKCVCKAWHAMITDPSFGNLHWENAHTRDPSMGILICHVGTNHHLHLSCLELGGGIKTLVTKPDLDTSYLQVSPSVNGLVCLSNTYDVHICNPKTRDFVTLPPHPRLLLFGRLGVGFGYSPSTKEYKVVVSIGPLNEQECKCGVIALGSRSWRTVTRNIPYRVLTNPVGVDGSIYWIGLPFGNTSTFTIVAFNVGTEEFVIIDLPPGMLDDTDYLHVRLARLMGTFCVVNGKETDMRNLDLEIWMLKENDHRRNHHHQWIVTHRILLDPFEFVFTYFIDFLCIYNGKLVLRPMGKDKAWLSCDLVTGAVEIIFSTDRLNYPSTEITTAFEESSTSLPATYLSKNEPLM